jgi:L-threonylcarbamoyladenylate synthase
MEQIKINFKKINNKDVNSVVKYLKQGKVIAYPTDTVYGLGCLATNEKAIKKIINIKKITKKRPFLVLMSDLKMVKQFCFVNKEQKMLLDKVWPGPVTVILYCQANLPKAVLGGEKKEKTLAVRLPKNDFLIKIIKKAGVPIISTSLNFQGKEVLKRPNNLEKYFKKYLPDLVIDTGVLKGEASRLIDIRDINNIKVLR